MADQRNIVPNADFGLRVAGQSVMEESSTQKHRLGERLAIGDRVFRYAKAGTALTAALVQGSAGVMVSEDTVTVAHPIGTVKVTVTAAGVSAGDYRDGYLTVDEGTGAGETYKIRDNTATVSGTIICTLYDSLVTAWSTADTDVTIIKSPYNAVIVCPVDGIIMPVGVPLIGITNAYYHWLQTWGPCGVKIDTAAAGAGYGGNAIDERVGVLSTNHAGQVMFVGTADSVEGAAPVAYCMLDSADHGDDKIEPVFLVISH